MITRIHATTEGDDTNLLLYTTENKIYLAGTLSLQLAADSSVFKETQEVFFGMTSKEDVGENDAPKQLVITRNNNNGDIDIDKYTVKQETDSMNVIANDLDETTYPVIMETSKAQNRLIYILYNTTSDQMTLYGRALNGTGDIDTHILNIPHALTYDVSYYDEQLKALYVISHNPETKLNQLITMDISPGVNFGAFGTQSIVLPMGRLHFMEFVSNESYIANETSIYRYHGPNWSMNNVVYTVQAPQVFYSSMIGINGNYVYFIAQDLATQSYKYGVYSRSMNAITNLQSLNLVGAPSHFVKAKKAKVEPIVDTTTVNVHNVGSHTEHFTTEFTSSYFLDFLAPTVTFTMYNSSSKTTTTTSGTTNIVSNRYSSSRIYNFYIGHEDVIAHSVNLESSFLAPMESQTTYFIHTCTENQNYPVINVTMNPTSLCHDYYCNNELGELGCSFNGFCSANNSCICDPTHYDYNCSKHKCFDVAQEDMNVCSNHGVCVNVNECHCQNGYHDVNCNVTECYNVLQNSQSVCSSHGDCVSINNCSCNTGYVEDDCNAHICYGINYKNSSVCSTHGACSNVDTCDCQAGFTGEKCQFPICYGVPSNESTTCGSHGTCISNNTCECTNDTIYSGPNCDEQVCFGIRHTNSMVCSGNGTCTSPGVCECTAGYFGENCQVPTCFSVFANQSTVCSEHGNCTHRDICQCNSKWAGINCEIPRCYGTPSTDEGVCSGHGNCPSVDTCICNENYVGEHCQYAVCFGKNATNPNVCSSHGDCNLANTCTCNPKYHGDECNIVDCFNVWETSPSVCQGRGSCEGPDICNCTSGYAGSVCQYYVCDGKYPGQPGLCSGHGSCIDIDTCYCQNNYYGQFCQNTYCHSLESTDDNVCSKQGNCTEYNQCECDNGFSGDKCQFEAVCAGLNASNAQTCSGNGECIRNDVCQCKSGYYGAFCGEPICYGVKHENSSVCLGRGSCVSKDSCNCIDGWTQDCSIPECNGIIQGADNVCSGYGDCSGPNQCDCHNETLAWGQNCEQFKCFGKLNLEADVCSGHGACGRIDECTCDAHYSGLECNNFTCYGQEKSTSCNLHGECTAHDTCSCHDDDTHGHWEGELCDRCKYNYKGDNCSELICSPDGTCKGNGICVNLLCSCFNNTQKGHFQGERCDQCIENYFGEGCDQFCTGSENCNSHGHCTSNNEVEKPFVCSCDASRSAGFWFGESCERCHPEFFGPTCKNSIPSVFNFSSTNDRLLAKIFTSSEVSTLDCKKMFHPSSLALLGENAICRYTDFENGIVEIIFGSNPKLWPGTQILYNLLGTEAGESPKYYGIPTKPAVNPLPPSAIFNTPAVIGVCSDFEPDASPSYAPDRRPLKYHWTCLSGSNQTAINALIADNTNSLPVIPSKYMVPNEMYEFSLQVENFLGIKSNMVLKKIYKSSKAVPFARIRGPPIQNAPSRGYFALDGTSKASDCMFSSDNVGFNWTQVGGPAVKLETIANNKKLILSNILSIGNTYEFEMKVFIKDDPLAFAVAKTRVIVPPSKLVSVISGGDRNIVVGTPLVLNASSSYDPDLIDDTEQFSWSCSLLPINHACANFPYGQLNSAVNVVENMLAGNYKITLTYKKGGRISTSEALVNVLLSTGPTVKILNVPTAHLTQKELRLSANVSSVSTNPDSLTYSWRMWEGHFEIILSEKIISTPINAPYISFLPHTLKPGSTYKIGLYARDDLGLGYSNIDLYVSRPPRLGTVHVSPNTGYALDVFKIAPSNFVSDSSGTAYGLKYGFYYYDPVTGKKNLLIQETVANTVWVKIPTPGNASNNYMVDMEIVVSDENQSQQSTTFQVQVKPLLAKSYDMKMSMMNVLLEATNVTTVQKQLKNTEERVRSLFNIAKGLTIATESFILPKINITTFENVTVMVNGSLVEQTVSTVIEQERVVNITQTEIVEIQNFVTTFKDKIVKQVINESQYDETPKSKQSVQQELMVLGASLEQVEMTSNDTRTRSLDHIENLYSSHIDKLDEDEQLEAMLSVSSKLMNANTFNSTSPFRLGIDKTPVKEWIAGPNGTVIEKNNTLKTYGELYEEAQAPSEESVNATRRLYSIVNNVADVLMKKQWPDQKPHFIKSNDISISAFVQSPSLMKKINQNTSSLLGSSSESTLQVHLSPDIAYNPDMNETRKENIQVKMIAFPENPNAQAANAKYQASSYMRLDFTSNNQKIKVENLTTPILFTIPGTFDIKKLELHSRKAGYKPLCAFYNTVNDTFDTTGCRVVGIYETYIQCACNHATDFMSLISYVTPELDFLTYQDLLNITKLNQDNMETTIVLCVLLNIYIVIMGVLEVVYLWSQRASKKLKLRLDAEKTILQRGWCYKQGGSIKSWKNRYMKLTTTSLTYGKNNEYTINQIMTKYIRGVTKTSHSNAPEKYNEYGLSIRLETDEIERIYRLAFKSEEQQSLWYDAVRESMDHSKVRKKNEEKRGILRPFFETLRDSHLWLSVIFLPARGYNYTKSQRVTVIYLLVLGIMASNAMSFQAGYREKDYIYGGANETKYILTGYVADLLTQPFALFIAFLFAKLRANKKELVQEDFNVEDFLNEVKLNRFWVAKEDSASVISGRRQVVPPFLQSSTKKKENGDTPTFLPAFPSTIVKGYTTVNSPSTPGTPVDTPTTTPGTPVDTPSATPGSPEHENNTLFLPAFPNQSTLPKKDVVKLEVQESDDSDDIDPGFWADERPEEDMKLSRFDGVKKNLGRIADILIDRLDNVLYFVLRILKRVDPRILGVITLIIATIIYFACVAAGAVVMYTISWLGIIAITVFVTQSTAAYVGVMFALYLKAKIRTFYKDPSRQWRGGTSYVVNMVVSFLILGLAILGAILTLSIGPWVLVEVSKTDPNIFLNVGYLMVTYAFFSSIIGIFAIWIWRHWKIPSKRPKSKFRRLLSKKWFPWWFKYPVYILAWLLIATFSFVLVLYGLKFSLEMDTQISGWYFASSCATGQNIGLDETLKFVINSIVVVTILNLFDLLFFQPRLRKILQKHQAQARTRINAIRRINYDNSSLNLNEIDITVPELEMAMKDQSSDTNSGENTQTDNSERTPSPALSQKDLMGSFRKNNDTSAFAFDNILQSEGGSPLPSSPSPFPNSFMDGAVSRSPSPFATMDQSSFTSSGMFSPNPQFHEDDEDDEETFIESTDDEDDE